MHLTRILGVAAMLAFLGSVPVASPAAAQEAFHCDWPEPEYPHISSHNLRPEHGGTIDIKTSVQGSCNPTTQPITVQATMTLERLNLGLFWLPVATGAAITKSLQGTGASWRRNELFALLAPCVPGTYRGVLNVKYRSSGSAVIPDFDTRWSRAVEIDCKAKRVSMVIDDTGSMAGVIGSVRSALNGYITSQPEDEYTRWNLTTFKDSARDIGTTEERDQIVNWVSALTASGGGDCPENALGGISTGLSALGTESGTGKQMLVATDASTHSGDVDGIIAAARAAGVKVNVLLTGDCDEGVTGLSAQADQGNAAAAGDVKAADSSQVVLKRIATETGGKYFFLPEGDTDDFTAALSEIFDTFANPAPGAPTGPASPSPPQAGPGLPVTGGRVGIWVVAGVALVIVGTLLVLRMRRRTIPDC